MKRLIILLGLTVSAMGQTTSYFVRCNTTTCSGELLPYAPAPVNDDAADMAAWIEQQHIDWSISKMPEFNTASSLASSPCSTDGKKLWIQDEAECAKAIFDKFIAYSNLQEKSAVQEKRIRELEDAVACLTFKGASIYPCTYKKPVLVERSHAVSTTTRRQK